MTGKTLYVSDLDGTLLNKDKEVSEYTKSVINAFINNGGHFSIATARTAASVGKILSGININMPVVLMNGAVVFNLSNDKYIKTELIASETTHSILKILKEHDISGFMYSICNGKMITYYENLEAKALRDFYDERIQRYYKSFEKVDSFMEKAIEKNVIYFTLIDEYEQLLTVFNSLRDQPNVDMSIYKDIYDENLWYLEIYSINASKYNAVKYLRDKCKYNKIVGFGDNHNDIPFLKACDEFYSVSNGVYDLKELATGIIDSNLEDGVAKFLMQKEYEVLK